LRDVLTTLARRMPGVRVVIYPSPVQGQGAGERIAAAIRTASARSEVDVLIVCRGGGSLEDLWAFNEEIVARAIADCALPVVSGVGHETDFTIADFVADARAPTPTAAAELVSANRAELLPRLRQLAARLASNAGRLLDGRSQQIDFLARRLLHPGERIGAQSRNLAQLAARMKSCAGHAVDASAWRVGGLDSRLRAAQPDVEGQLAQNAELRVRLALGHARSLAQMQARMERLGAHLAHLSPQAVLERGYSIVSLEDGSIVRTSRDVRSGAGVHLTFAQGSARARVEAVATDTDVTKSSE